MPVCDGDAGNFRRSLYLILPQHGVPEQKQEDCYDAHEHPCSREPMPTLHFAFTFSPDLVGRLAEPFDRKFDIVTLQIPSTLDFSLNSDLSGCSSGSALAFFDEIGTTHLRAYKMLNC